MTKQLLTTTMATLLILAFSSISMATPINLELKTFIWNEETLSQVSTGLNDGSIIETSWYSEADASNTNSTRLGCFFDIPDTTQESLDLPLYLDFSWTDNGTTITPTNHVNFSVQTEFHNENWMMFHLPAFIGDTSLLTQVNWTGYYGDDVISVAMYLGEEPINSDPVPEPATMFLFGIGLLGLAGIGRKSSTN